MRRTLGNGFTLVELMVTIAVIGILSAIVYASVSGASLKGRDVDRQADIRNLKNAIEQYKQKYGAYPEPGCTAAPNAWVFEQTCSQYVVGIAPEFLSVLPHDPTAVGTEKGYAYMANAERSVFKIAALNSVESEVVTSEHPFKRCDTSGICTATDSCDVNMSAYQTSYAAWGGYADGATDALVKANTAETICK